MPGLTSLDDSSSFCKALCSRAKDAPVHYGGLHPFAGCPLFPCAPFAKNSSGEQSRRLIRKQEYSRAGETPCAETHINLWTQWRGLCFHWTGSKERLGKKYFCSSSPVFPENLRSDVVSPEHRQNGTNRSRGREREKEQRCRNVCIFD